MWASPTPPPAWKSGARTGHSIPNSTLLRWEQVGGGGLGDRNTMYAELIPFNGDLYAWTSNYITGQEVRRLDPGRRLPHGQICDPHDRRRLGLQTHRGRQPLHRQQPGLPKLDRLRHVHLPPGRQLQPGPRAWTHLFLLSSPATPTAPPRPPPSTRASRLPTGASAWTATAIASTPSPKRPVCSPKPWAQSPRSRSPTPPPAPGKPITTPGANGYAIADEGLWGDPATTGASTDIGYTGAHGPTLPALDVVIGGGHPSWNTSYVNMAMRSKLATEATLRQSFAFVERLAGSEDGGTRLQTAALTTKSPVWSGSLGAQTARSTIVWPTIAATTPKTPPWPR